ncbi:MAG: hypothetical protein OQK69_00510 [Gammaproteobacteria bacterium]|nr:hypothetical protein [Gammaproteobacteria bacterium]
MKSYSLFLLSGISSVLLAVSVFNWIINPYDVFDSPVIQGLNEYKSETGRYARLSKFYQVERVKPDVILLATSRGMVVPDEYFSTEDMTGFNFSMPSASIYELYRAMQHAHAIKPLKRVVIGIDEEFVNGVQPNFSEGRVIVNYNGDINVSKWIQRIKDVFLSLLSINAFRSSVSTIKKQKESPSLIGYKQHYISRVVRAGGHRQMFRKMESSVFYSHDINNHGCDKKLMENKSMPSVNIYFEKIIDLAYKENIDLHVYFSPIHARLYEVKHMIGKWPCMEKTKQDVVNVVEYKAKQYGRMSYPVWDFSGYNAITMEAVPEKDDSLSMMTWYFEGSHYTRDTANCIFSNMFNKKDMCVNFGIKLTSADLDKHLYDIRSNRKTYIKHYNEDINEIGSMLDSVVR